MLPLSKRLVLFEASILILFSSCEKFLDVGYPPSQISADYVYQSNASSAAVLTGIYYDLAKNTGIAQGPSSISFQCGLSADEFGLNAGERYGFRGVYENNLNKNFWTPLYNVVYRANAAIEGLSKSSSLAIGVKQQLLGEALFIRAFCYFYLINLYGDVPLLLNSDYRLNVSTSRSEMSKVYNQMISDLQEAKRLMNDIYVGADAFSPNTERIRPNKLVATALLARVYLFMSNWEEAIGQAEELISYSSLYDIVSINEVFLKNSREAIWQLQPIDVSGRYKNTQDARIFVMINGPDEQRPLWASQQLLNVFEKDDSRRNNWLQIDSSSNRTVCYFFKYKRSKPSDPSEEYLMVFRLAEQYLIRAEAYAQLGIIDKAISDLNTIRKRAHLGSMLPLSKEELLKEILREREREFFSEWGHRWFDLKRTGKINQVMTDVSPLKGGIWQSYKSLYDIPKEDIRLNPNIVQNPGYNS